MTPSWKAMTMTDIVEHVASAVREAGAMSKYLRLEDLVEAQTRAAIIATLQYVRENVSYPIAQRCADYLRTGEEDVTDSGMLEAVELYLQILLQEIGGGE